MSEKITNKFTFYGNAETQRFERELITRFQEDSASGKDAMTAVKRLVFGLAEEDAFESFEKIGAQWAWYFGSTQQFELESKQCALDVLQDYITLHAAMLDPDVVVQMDYVGNTPELVGTRLTCIDKEFGLISELAEEDLNCIFCDEDDIEEVLESQGHNNVTVMSYQELDQLIMDLRETAVYDFNRASNKQPVLLVKK